tara:strand:- start:4593 stop:5795 length:1203 start_codon:yes stop_codon:yes gene_type:complete
MATFNLVHFLRTRPDEASMIVKHLSLLDVANLQSVCRDLRPWSQGAMRQILGNQGQVVCGTDGLQLDLLSMRFTGGMGPDRGVLFFTGLFTQNGAGETCRVLLRSCNSRYSLCWDTFNNASPRSQKLKAHTHAMHVIRPLMLPAEFPDRQTLGLCKGLLIVSPCGHDQHDFIPYDQMAEFIDSGQGGEYTELSLFNELYEVDKNTQWSQAVTPGCLYESAVYVQELQGVVYGNYDMLCFKSYCPRKGFSGKVTALPLAHSVRRHLIPHATTLAYEPFSGTLYVVGGKLPSGRKSGAVYAFALREYLLCYPHGNTQVTSTGIFPIRTVNKAQYPGHRFLFHTVCNLRHERAWCAVRFAHQGKVMIVWGGQGKGNKHPSAVEIFYNLVPFNIPLASPDNVIW